MTGYSNCPTASVAVLRALQNRISIFVDPPLDSLARIGRIRLVEADVPAVGP
jgi:hypothetical protein